MANIGITMYFRANRIHIWKDTIRALKHPEYIHLLINEKEKQLFIKGCERDLDAFRLDHLTDKTERCYVNAKTLLRYLARLIDADPEGESYRFAGRLLEDGAVYINLKEYTLIEMADDEDADDEDPDDEDAEDEDTDDEEDE